MSPGAIAEKAASAGLDAAALTDHNSALNCRTFEICCKKQDLLPIFGIEVTTVEEAHILCLFGSVDAAEELGSIVYDKLPPVPNKPETFGDQVYVDEHDNITGEVAKYLVSAAEISIDELLGITTALNGLFIPAHIDRPVFSIPSQLGFLPQLPYSAVEAVSLPCDVETANIPIIRNSDAHYLEDIGRRYTTYNTNGADFKFLAAAIINGAAIT